MSLSSLAKCYLSKFHTQPLATILYQFNTLAIFTVNQTTVKAIGEQSSELPFSVINVSPFVQNEQSNDPLTVLYSQTKWLLFILCVNLTSTVLQVHCQLAQSQSPLHKVTLQD